MPACKNCRRFVMIGRGNDVRVDAHRWAHKTCPPTPGATGRPIEFGRTYSGAEVSRIAGSPSAMMQLMMGRSPDPDDL